ncbi:DUF7344 domain-containing protein [Haloarcula laminariae]|uniref:DUF7344 domain-containing protein n=1 Tax=Haloarcula laminariae TaxID=2961577 RepID=UPI0021C5F12C|nr:MULTISPECIES: hypothetical protein [Halomicroarcula]
MSDHQARGESSGGPPPRLADDEFYRALSSRRRRRVLAVLLDRGECSRDELATMLAGWESTRTGGMATRDDRERILLDLHHTHLPTLVDSDLVAYDRDRGTVTLDTLETETRALIHRSVEAEK